MGEIVVRATEAHLPDIVRLVGRLRAEEGLAGAPAASAVRAYLDDPTAAVFVAIHQGRPVGMVSVRIVSDLFHAAPAALIQELVIDEEHRGMGLGGALLDTAVAHAAERGCAEVSVATGAGNEVAQALYRSRGFEAHGVWFERHF